MSAILVVEQDPGYANRIVAALRAAGHEVVIAGHRDEAETATRSRHPDLVLANGMMPGAKELLGRFSSSQGGPGSVVLLPVTLASHTTPDAYSADGVLSKPFSDEDLERVVSGCLTPAAPQAAPPQPAPPRSVPQPPTPQPAAPQPAAPQPAAPKPAAAPQPAPPQQAAPKPPKATVDDDIDDLLNRTLSGLDIASLTKKRPKPRPAAPEPAAPEPAAPEPAAPEPAAPQLATAQPAAPPPATPPAAASRSSLTSTDIFGDVLAEVQAESEKTRSRQSTPPQVAAPPPGPAAPQPEAPQPPAPQPAAPRPAAPKPPTQRRPNFDDDLDRKLEETLSGVLPSRLRRKPAEPAPGPAAPEPAAPQPAAPQPAAPQPATTPPSANFGAPMPEPASSPPPAPVEPDLPPDFSEDETVSIVRPVTLQRDESTPAPAPQAEEADPPDTSGAEPAQDTVPEPDAFATTLLPTRSDGSSQVQPPADFTPMSEQPPASEPAPPQPAALEPPAPQPAAPQPAASEPAASEPPAPQPAAGMPSFGDLGDGSDEFEISFGEEPPEAPEDENIWAAYGSGETAGWSTTSFEAQSPVTETPAMESSAAPASESVAPPPATPQPAAPEPAAPQPAAPEPAALDLDADETAAPDPSLDATDRGADSGWDPDTGWGTVEGAATDEEAVPVPPAAAPSGPSDFDADASVWDVPSVDEEPASSQARPSEEPPIWEPQEPIGDPDFSSLQEDPVLEFDEDFLPPPLQPSEPEPSAPEPAAPEPAAPEPAAPEPAAPEPAAPELSAPEPAAPEPAEPAAPEPAVPEPTAPLLAPGNAFGDLSHELGAEDSGFHTALQGVLQIRGGDEEATAAGDQGLPFGDYRLLERVAVGGMAEVWRARRRGVEGFQKTVAIKRILSHLTGSTDFITMFIDEAKLAAQLNHANIAQIYDLGKVDEDFYIAMEFVDGRDLRTLLREANQKRKPLPLGLAMMIIAAVARGLDYAHRKRDFENRELGLVHRDVSPQNVLVSTEGEIKLCDFGIVKAVAKASTTQMGALKGKLQYMSPEQAWGKDVDGRSDIFSLGSVMFEALTGEKLFTGDSEIGVLDAVRDCRIKSARSIDPTIPESVERILEKTLKPTPGERYQTAGEMEKDIQAVLETLKPTPGQSELSTYMHSLVEAEPAATERQAADARSGTGATGAAGEQDPSAAWTGTSWGTASFAADEQADVVSSKPPEPVTSRPAATASSAVPASSKVPVSSKVAASSKMPPPKASKKGGGKLIWILLVLTMLAIVAVVAWTRLRDSGPSSEAAPEAPEATTPLPTEGAEASAGAAGEGAAAEGEEVDQKQLLEQIMQEELDRKKKEMEEQFEAQKEELERRLKEVEGDG